MKANLKFVTEKCLDKVPDGAKLSDLKICITRDELKELLDDLGFLYIDEPYAEHFYFTLTGLGGQGD